MKGRFAARAARWGIVVVLALGTRGSAAAQDLADFDYENLSFRGLGLEIGRLWPTRVEPTYSYGIRADLGYLGPGLRIVPGVTYWSSEMKRAEVRELEARVEELIARQDGVDAGTIDLGRIDWSDVVLSLDGHVVWAIPYGLLTYAGLGVSAHVLNGGGAAVDDTFVEDLLDSVTAGGNVHGGVEYPVGERLRFYGSARGELLGDFQYVELRLGGQFMFGSSAPGEVRR